MFSSGLRAFRSLIQTLQSIILQQLVSSSYLLATGQVNLRSSLAQRSMSQATRSTPPYSPGSLCKLIVQVIFQRRAAPLLRIRKSQISMQQPSIGTWTFDPELADSNTHLNLRHLYNELYKINIYLI